MEAAEEQRRQMSQVEEEEGENEASLSLPCGRQKGQSIVVFIFKIGLGDNSFNSYHLMEVKLGSYNP